MADIVFLAVIVAFFMLCVGYVSLCGRIVGPNVVEVEADDDTEIDELVEEAA